MWKSKFNGAFVLNRRVNLHAIDATHWLISTQAAPISGTSARHSSWPTTRSTVVPAAKSASVAPARGMLGMS